MSDCTTTILLGKRIRFSTQRNVNDEGIVIAVEFIKESKNDEPATGYAVLMNSGEIRHIAAWRINGLISAAEASILPILSKTLAVENLDNKSPEPVRKASSSGYGSSFGSGGGFFMAEPSGGGDSFPF